MKLILQLESIKFKFFYYIFFISCLSMVYGQEPADFGFIEGVNFKKNVVYKTVDGNHLVLDILYPNADKMKDKNPWMLFVHGGGWAGGSKDNIYKTAFLGTLQNLLNNGVVCATIGYRLAKAPVTSYESVIDCKDAARFLLKNAKSYKLHDQNYGIWGGSAGGHLSLVTALVPDAHFLGDADLSNIHPKYKCVASFFPFTSCLNEDIRPGSIFADGKLFNRLLGGTLEEKPELARLLSPTEFLDANSPPILLVHGDKDTTLPIINSQYMLKVAKEKNADVELLTIKNGPHSLSGNISPTHEEMANYISNFILSRLK